MTDTGSTSVLHLTTSFPKTYQDSSGIFILRLIEHLMQLGIPCWVLAPGSKSEETFGNVLRFNYAPSRFQFLSGRPGGIPAALRKNPYLFILVPSLIFCMGLALVRFAKNFNLIHAHWSICGLVAIITKPLHHKPVITTLRGSDVSWAEKILFYRMFHSYTLRHSDFVVGVNGVIVDRLKLKYSTRSERFVFIPNGVDHAFFEAYREHTISTSPIKLLFVGSLIKRKGLDVLINALTRVRGEYRLTIVGDGPEKESLNRLVIDNGLESNVVFVGTRPPWSIPSIMASHDLLILPSYSEGRPNVILEAMAAGLPVLATDIDGTRELVCHKENGWLFPPGDSKTLAKELTAIIRQRHLIPDMGKRASNWIRSNGLTWENTASSYAKLYKRALAL